jgi:hypothetical protein
LLPSPRLERIHLDSSGSFGNDGNGSARPRNEAWKGIFRKFRVVDRAVRKLKVFGDVEGVEELLKGANAACSVGKTMK